VVRKAEEVAVVGMRSRSGQVKAKLVVNINKNAITSLVNNNVERGSVLCTDEARIYSGIPSYDRLVINHSVGEFVNGISSTNRIESV
jgi:hypothetical protein